MLKTALHVPLRYITLYYIKTVQTPTDVLSVLSLITSTCKQQQ